MQSNFKLNKPSLPDILPLCELEDNPKRRLLADFCRPALKVAFNWAALPNMLIRLKLVAWRKLSKSFNLPELAGIEGEFVLVKPVGAMR